MRLPLVVHTSADVKTLLANSRQVRRLPESGLKISIAGLDPLLADKLNGSIVAYVKACGCAAGGVFALVSLAAVVAGLAVQMAQHGPHWSDIGLAAIGLFGAVLMGGLGKVCGLVLARWQFERRCREVIRVLSRDQERKPGGSS